MEFLEKLRSKPEALRRAIAFWASLGITIIIALGYLGSLTLSTQDNQVASPFESLKQEWNNVTK